MAPFLKTTVRDTAQLDGSKLALAGLKNPSRIEPVYPIGGRRPQNIPRL